LQRAVVEAVDVAWLRERVTFRILKISRLELLLGRDESSDLPARPEGRSFST
jgi:hypothetical protein